MVVAVNGEFRDLEIWDDIRKRLEKKSVTDLHAVVRPKVPIAWGSGSGVPCAWGLKKWVWGSHPRLSDRELGLGREVTCLIQYQDTKAYLNFPCL